MGSGVRVGVGVGVGVGAWACAGCVHKSFGCFLWVLSVRACLIKIECFINYKLKLLT